MQYRIQKRKHSSNILERSTDGKHWEAFIAPLVKKDEGDILVEGLLKLYSSHARLSGLAEQMLKEQKQLVINNPSDYNHGIVTGINRIVKLIFRNQIQ